MDLVKIIKFSQPFRSKLRSSSDPPGPWKIFKASPRNFDGPADLEVGGTEKITRHEISRIKKYGDK